MNHQCPSFPSPTGIQKGKTIQKKPPLTLSSVDLTVVAFPFILAKQDRARELPQEALPKGRWKPHTWWGPVVAAMSQEMSTLSDAAPGTQRWVLLLPQVSSQSPSLPEITHERMKGGRQQGESCTCAVGLGGMYPSQWPQPQREARPAGISTYQ